MGAPMGHPLVLGGEKSKNSAHEFLFLIRKPHEASELAYLEDILVLRRLRERAFRDLACYFKELPGV